MRRLPTPMAYCAHEIAASRQRRRRTGPAAPATTNERRACLVRSAHPSADTATPLTTCTRASPRTSSPRKRAALTVDTTTVNAWNRLNVGLRVRAVATCPRAAVSATSLAPMTDEADEGHSVLRRAGDRGDPPHVVVGNAHRVPFSLERVARRRHRDPAARRSCTGDGACFADDERTTSHVRTLRSATSLATRVRAQVGRCDEFRRKCRQDLSSTDPRLR